MVNAAMWRVLSETYSFGRDVIFGDPRMHANTDWEEALNEKESFYHVYPTLSPTLFPRPSYYSASDTSDTRPQMEDIVAPFFLVASILLSLALLYSILFLCLLRFGDFSDSDNEGRIYLCGRRFYIPFFWFLRLYLREGTNGARSIVGNVPRHFMTREERTTAILELLDGTFVTIDQAEVTRLRALAEVRRLEEEGDILLPIMDDEGESLSEPKNAAVPECGGSVASQDTVSASNEKPIEGQTIVKSMEAEETKEEIETPAASHECISNADDIPDGTIENKELVVERNINNIKSSKTVRFTPIESEEYNEEVTDTVSPEYIIDNDAIPNLDGGDSALGASFESTSEEIVCSICLEEYELGDICVAPNSCNHRFHKECTMSWLNRRNNSGCPYCRRDIVDNAEVWTIVQRLRHERKRMQWKQRRNRASTMLKRFAPRWKRQPECQSSRHTITTSNNNNRHGDTASIVREDTAAPNQHPSSTQPHRTNYMDLEMGEA